MSTPDFFLEQLEHQLAQTLDWSRERDYAGYSKHDALNSPLLSACSLGVPFLRLAITQVVMRAPVNIRPWLGVPRGRNPKGIGLFAHALLDRAETTGDPVLRGRCLAEAEGLLAWLIHHASPHAPASAELRAEFPFPGPGLAPVAEAERRKGLGWGYHYPWQDQGFFQPRHYPNRVVSSWIALAFLRAAELTGDARHLLVVGEIVDFLVLNPRALHESEEQLCLSYVPLDDIEWAVMDVSALVSAVLSRYAARLDSGDSRREELRRTARRLMAFVVDKQTDYGAWFYTWPARDSHITHDNYHTGIILDCLADYMDASGDRAWEPAYRRGLAYYRKALFESDGAPRWMNDRRWPHDIHGAASGILCFTRAAQVLPAERAQHLAFADAILGWTLHNLRDPRGFFYYQRTRFHTKRFCLMRWCNAWMCRALAQRLRVGMPPGAA